MNIAHLPLIVHFFQLLQPGTDACAPTRDVCSSPLSSVAKFRCEFISHRFVVQWELHQCGSRKLPRVLLPSKKLTIEVFNCCADDGAGDRVIEPKHRTCRGASPWWPNDDRKLIMKIVLFVNRNHNAETQRLNAIHPSTAKQQRMVARKGRIKPRGLEIVNIKIFQPLRAFACITRRGARA